MTNHPLAVLRRESNNMTQAELARLSGVSVDVIGKIESGARMPRSVALAKVARALGVHATDIASETQREDAELLR